MCTLRIEHAIVDFETWKAAFDRDPVGRGRSGVRSHRVFRPLDDARYVMIDLDFDTAGDAERFLETLRQVWSKSELSPGLARDGAAAPRVRVIDGIESVSY